MRDPEAISVLIIEDNQDLAANIADYLEAKGYLADVAMDGVTGLHLAVTQPHDVIVLDLMLPGIDGLSLCRRTAAGRAFHRAGIDAHRARHA